MNLLFLGLLSFACFIPRISVSTVPPASVSDDVFILNSAYLHMIPNPNYPVSCGPNCQDTKDTSSVRVASPVKLEELEGNPLSPYENRQNSLLDDLPPVESSDHFKELKRVKRDFNANERDVGSDVGDNEKGFKSVGDGSGLQKGMIPNDEDFNTTVDQIVNGSGVQERLLPNDADFKTTVDEMIAMIDQQRNVLKRISRASSHEVDMVRKINDSLLFLDTTENVTNDKILSLSDSKPTTSMINVTQISNETDIQITSNIKNAEIDVSNLTSVLNNTFLPILNKTIPPMVSETRILNDSVIHNISNSKNPVTNASSTVLNAESFAILNTTISTKQDLNEKLPKGPLISNASLELRQLKEDKHNNSVSNTTNLISKNKTEDGILNSILSNTLNQTNALFKNSSVEVKRNARKDSEAIEDISKMFDGTDSNDKSIEFTLSESTTEHEIITVSSMGNSIGFNETIKALGNIKQSNASTNTNKTNNENVTVGLPSKNNTKHKSNSSTNVIKINTYNVPIVNKTNKDIYLVRNEDKKTSEANSSIIENKTTSDIDFATIENKTTSDLDVTRIENKTTSNIGLAKIEYNKTSDIDFATMENKTTSNRDFATIENTTSDVDLETNEDNKTLNGPPDNEMDRSWYHDEDVISDDIIQEEINNWIKMQGRIKDIKVNLDQVQVNLDQARTHETTNYLRNIRNIVAAALLIYMCVKYRQNICACRKYRHVSRPSRDAIPLPYRN